MDTVPLVSEQVDGGSKLLHQLPQNGFEVTVAFWLQPTDRGRWYFYIVSPVVETEGPAEAYGRLHASIRRMPQPLGIDPLKVKLIGPTHPIARDVLDIHKQAPDPRTSPVRWGGNQLGNLSVEGTYLYPLPSVASR